MSWRDRVGEIASLLDSGNTARTMLGQYLTLLSTAYDVTNTYQVGPLGEQPANQSREYLDGIRTRAESDFAKLQSNDDPLDPALANQIAFDIYSIEKATNQTIGILGGNTALGDLGDSISDAFGHLPDLVPKPPGGWWVWLRWLSPSCSSSGSKSRRNKTMPDNDETDFHYGFVAGVLVALLVLWWMRHKRKARAARAASGTSGEVMSVSTPGVPSGPGPVETHVEPTSV